MKEIHFFLVRVATRTQTQSDHCLTNVNVDGSAVFKPNVSIYQSDGFNSNFTAVGVGF